MRLNAAAAAGIRLINIESTSASVWEEPEVNADPPEVHTWEILQLLKETWNLPPQHLLTLYIRMMYERLHHPQWLWPIKALQPQQKQCAGIDSLFPHALRRHTLAGLRSKEDYIDCNWLGVYVQNSELKGWSADLSLGLTAWSSGYVSPQLVMGSASSGRTQYFTSRTPAVRKVTGPDPSRWSTGTRWLHVLSVSEICTTKCLDTAQARCPMALLEKATSPTFSCPCLWLTLYLWSWRSNILLLSPCILHLFPKVPEVLLSLWD